MAYAQQKVTIQIPTGYTQEQRIAIGKEIINFIRYRTKQENVDTKNKSFADYSDQYEDDKNSARVNLTKTGDMLNNLELLDNSLNSVTIGYKEDYDGMGKVEGNRIGSYGQPNANPKKARDFMGITKEDLNRILSNYRKPDSQLSRIQENLSREAESLTPTQLKALGLGLFAGFEDEVTDVSNEDDVINLDDFNRIF